MHEEEKKLAEELLFSENKLPSFAKRIFFGDFDSSQVFPFPKSDVDQDYLNQVKAFVDSSINADKIDRDARIPDEVVQGLAKLGVLGMTVSKSFGGLGMSQQAYCKVTEMVAATCASTALYINVHQSIGLKSLLLYGSEEQKKRWLLPLAKGEITAAFSLTEPNAGSDANGVETRAVFDKENNVYRITGRKQWTTNGAIADVLTVMAKTEVETPTGVQDKVTAFLVTPDMPGFKVKDKALEKLGMRGTWTANLEFNDMAVPAENILGPKGGGLRVCLTVLDFGRVTFGSTCTGVAKELVRLATDHAINRHQFKRPLASFALVKEKIAKMHALALAMEATTYLTAGFIDRNMEDFMLEAAILKVFASDAVWDILYDTMQIYGGRSFFTDQPFERMLRDARLNMIGEGSNEVLRAFIAAVGMRDVGMEFKENLSHPLRLASIVLKKLKSPKIIVKTKELEPLAAKLSSAIRKLSLSTTYLLAKYKEEIVEKQLQLNRISSSAIAIYTSTAVLSYLDSQTVTDEQIKVGKYYINMAMKQLRRHLKGINRNQDSRTENLSDEITKIK